MTGAHDDRVVHLALLHLAARNRVLDAHLDDITDVAYRRFEPPSTLMHIKLRAPLLSAAFKQCTHLNHGFVLTVAVPRGSTTRTRRQFLCLDNGRHSSMVTTSPSLALVVLVVRLQLRRAAHVLAVRRMLHKRSTGDRDGLLHLVADRPCR